MTDTSLEERLAAVERALTDGDPVADLSDAADRQARLDDLAGDLEALGERVDALEATVQSLHGYVGEIEHVNERVERRADAARAAVERLDDQARARPSETSRQRERTDRPAEQQAPARTNDVDRAGGVPTEGAAGGDGDEDADSILSRVRSSL